MVVFGAFVLWYVLTKGRGGIIVKQMSATFTVLDDRFAGCKPVADRTWFKNGRDHKFELEIDNVPLDTGAELIAELNGFSLATLVVARDKEAEYEVLASLAKNLLLM